tara:strand:+ start:1511 stop:1669 length:159 start_codon:yes stop_codon:yes gene_type:complete
MIKKFINTAQDFLNSINTKIFYAFEPFTLVETLAVVSILLATICLLAVPFAY